MTLTLAICACSDGDSPDTTGASSAARPTSDLLTSELPRAVERACAQVERTAPRRVITCPTLVPAGPVELERVEVDSKPDRNLFIYTMSFVSKRLPLDRNDPNTLGDGHWVIEASQPAKLVRTGLFLEPPDHVAQGTIDNQSVEEVTGIKSPAGIDAHHAAVVWIDHGVGYLVSVHGDENLNIARALAAGMIDADE